MRERRREESRSIVLSTWTGHGVCALACILGRISAGPFPRSPSTTITQSLDKMSGRSVRGIFEFPV